MIVTCNHCEIPVDPLRVLMSYAEEERKFLWAEKEMSQLHFTIKRLREEERKLKGRLYRAKKKAAQLGLNLKTTSTESTGDEE